ncbi:MAG: hypothetical protein H6715_06225 [Myxococcales bacterium]|nr:hypothetical protein [Myxococcales bacterium]
MSLLDMLGPRLMQFFSRTEGGPFEEDVENSQGQRHGAAVFTGLAIRFSIMPESKAPVTCSLTFALPQADFLRDPITHRCAARSDLAEGTIAEYWKQTSTPPCIQKRQPAMISQAGRSVRDIGNVRDIDLGIMRRDVKKQRDIDETLAAFLRQLLL